MDKKLKEISAAGGAGGAVCRRRRDAVRAGLTYLMVARPTQNRFTLLLADAPI